MSAHWFTDSDSRFFRALGWLQMLVWANEMRIGLTGGPWWLTVAGLAAAGMAGTRLLQIHESRAAS